MTLRAVYQVVAYDHEGVEVLLLGDHHVTPVHLDGADARDALGKRQEQYEELIEVNGEVMRAETERRMDLAAQLVWQGEGK